MTDLALRRGRGIAVVEKWYTDALLPDGGVLVLYFVRLRLLGVPLAWVSAELTDASGWRRGGAAAAGRVRGGEGWLRFGPASVDGDTVRWSTRGLSGELELRPRHPPAVLCDPVFVGDGQLVRWEVEVPDAAVRATLRWPGGSTSVEARGYRDRVLACAVPWRFPVRSLAWGHAAAGDRAAIWFETQTAEGAHRAGWRDGVLSDDAAAPERGEPRVLLDERLGERLAGRLAPAVPLLRRLTSDPHQRRWTAEADLCGRRGRAVWEEVRWG